MKKKDEIVDEEHKKKKSEVLTECYFGKPSRKKGKESEGKSGKCVERMNKFSEKSIECEKKKEKEDSITDYKAIQSEERNKGGKPRGVAERKLGYQIAGLRVSKPGKIKSGSFAIYAKEDLTRFGRKCEVAILCQAKCSFTDRSLISSGEESGNSERTDEYGCKKRNEDYNFEIDRCSNKELDPDKERNCKSERSAESNQGKKEETAQGKRKSKPAEEDERNPEESQQGA